MGRLLTNNIMNLGIRPVIDDGLHELNIELNELERIEADAGLGNGGLGRLAACFMDSIASLGIPGYGNGLRYRYGFFEQKIIDGYQVEIPRPASASIHSNSFNSIFNSCNPSSITGRIPKFIILFVNKRPIKNSIEK